MKILLIIADLGLGGAQRVVINLANELSNQNHNVWIYDVEPSMRNEKIISKIKLNVNLISSNYGTYKLSTLQKVKDYFFLKIKLKSNYFFEKKAAWHLKNLKNIVKTHTFDVVNSHVCWADFFVFKNLKHLRDKWIITTHASYPDLFSQEKNWIKYQKLSKQTMIAAKGLIYLHEQGKLYLESKLEIPLVNAFKIFNGVPIPDKNKLKSRDHYGYSSTDFIILCASRAIKEKGWFELAESVSRINNDKLKLIFAGDGQILNQIKKDYGSEKNINFLGLQEDIKSLIGISDIVCLPSYTEALPTILIESIFQEKPVLATNVGAVKQIINNDKGKCGVLINSSRGDVLINDLVDEINCFLNEKYKFNNDAFKKAKSIFSLKNMVKKYLKLYDGLKK